MKKVTSILLALATLAACVALAIIPAYAAEEYWRVNPDVGCAVRSVPSASGSKLGGVAKDSIAVISEKAVSEGKTWGKISYLSVSKGGTWGTTSGGWIAIDPYCSYVGSPPPPPPVQSTVPQTVPPSSTSINLRVPVYKMSDSRWKDVTLNNTQNASKTATFGRVGCLAVAFTMVYDYDRGRSYTPLDMRNSGMMTFTTGGAAYWKPITDLGYVHKSLGGVAINASILNTIYEQLRAGKPVVIGAVGNSQHFVVVNGFNGDPNAKTASMFTIVNPNNDTSYSTLQGFTNKYWDTYHLVYSK